MIRAGPVTGVVVLAIFVALALALAADAVIYCRGGETVSEWLREHPRWFWLPAGIVVAFVYALGFHLWGPEWAR